MFADVKAFNGFSVDDTAKAAEFYGETLGLRVTEDNGILHLHIAGDRETIAYPKPNHVPASFTILNFPGCRHRGCCRRADRARRGLRAL